jgi:hypothetical protein
MTISSFITAILTTLVVLKDISTNTATNKVFTILFRIAPLSPTLFFIRDLLLKTYYFTHSFFHAHQNHPFHTACLLQPSFALRALRRNTKRVILVSVIKFCFISLTFGAIKKNTILHLMLKGQLLIRKSFFINF